MPSHKHTVLEKVNDAHNEKLITCTAQSKTFNLAELMTSNIIISNKVLREQYKPELDSIHGGSVGILGYKACELAYDESEDWLEELLDIIDTNQHLVHDFFKRNFQQIKAPLIEGTYVQWRSEERRVG